MNSMGEMMGSIKKKKKKKSLVPVAHALILAIQEDCSSKPGPGK
jgi:hypothetical protein